MKDRYFGDVHDYVKFALIRQLTDLEGARMAVCWMLTQDDAGKDGQRTSYLWEPEKWRAFDPQLFEFLRHQVLERESRNVRAIERSNLLRNCRFYSRKLVDDRIWRHRYFDQFLDFARGSPIVFFDPDNGVEVKSVRYGGRNSSKYLYWNEIDQALRASHSLLIYQHLPPKPRRPLIRRIAGRLLQASQGGVVYTIRTGKVAFFLVPQRGSALNARKSVAAAERMWEGVLTVSEQRAS